MKSLLCNTALSIKLLNTCLDNCNCNLRIKCMNIYILFSIIFQKGKTKKHYDIFIRRNKTKLKVIWFHFFFLSTGNVIKTYRISLYQWKKIYLCTIRRYRVKLHNTGICNGKQLKQNKQNWNLDKYFEHIIKSHSLYESNRHI